MSNPKLEKIAKQIFHDYCKAADEALLSGRAIPLGKFVMTHNAVLNCLLETDNLTREVYGKLQKLNWNETYYMGMSCFSRFGASDKFRLAVWRASRK